MRKKITEYIDLDVEKEMWVCNKCEHQLISAQENYKHGCLIYDRDPSEIHQPHLEGAHTFSPDPAWIRLVEFYCPGCGTLVETEILPPGHPITHDYELDLEDVKKSLLQDREVNVQNS